MLGIRLRDLPTPPSLSMIIPEILAMKDPKGSIKGCLGEGGGGGGDKFQAFRVHGRGFSRPANAAPLPDSSNILKIHVLIRIPLKGSHKGTITV